MDEKELILKCVEHLNANRNVFTYLVEIFPDMKRNNEMIKFESILKVSTLFIESPDKQFSELHFKLADHVLAQLTVLHPKELVDNYLIERDLLKQEKSATRDKLWYETAEAKKRFDDYPTIKRMAKCAIIIAALALIAQVIAIALHKT